MVKRKIQLIAGSTYSISLPKEWIKANNLKEQDEIEIIERDDKNLIISPQIAKERLINEISINVEEYLENIDQILFAIYYLGIETINIFSEKEITKNLKTKIRKTLLHLSGTEISYEDKKKLTIKVLLDKSKVDIRQLIYRISLIIDSSIEDLSDGLDINEITINENEIDRLYHLATKIITLSLKDSNILHSSSIKNVTLIPSYLLVCEKLESIGDNLNKLSQYLYKNKIQLNEEKEIINFAKNRINESAKHVLGGFTNYFKQTPKSELEKIKKKILKIKKDVILDCLRDVSRFISEIEEEIAMISFYTKLINEEKII